MLNVVMQTQNLNMWVEFLQYKLKYEYGEKENEILEEEKSIVDLELRLVHF